MWLEALGEEFEADLELQPGHGEFMVRLMEAVLTCNAFEFDQKMYTFTWGNW